MFVTPAFAQTGGAFSALGPAFDLVVPFVMIFVVMYFFMIRPRQQQLKKHQDMLAAVRRGVDRRMHRLDQRRFAHAARAPQQRIVGG